MAEKQYPTQPKDVRTKACATCRFATWTDLTKGGRLSRGGDWSSETVVECGWKPPQVVVEQRPAWALGMVVQTAFLGSNGKPVESQRIWPLDDECPPPGQCATYEAVQ